MYKHQFALFKTVDYHLILQENGRNFVDRNSGEQEFLTPEEVGRLLRCGRTKTYELLQSGAIMSYRVGRNRIVRRSDLTAWLAGQREEAGGTWGEFSR